MGNKTLKGIKASVLALMATIAFAGSALATNYYPNDIGTLATYLNSAHVSYAAPTAEQLSTFTGNFNFTPLAYEAQDTIQLRTASSLLFTNKNLTTASNSEFGQVKLSDVASTYFYDTTTKTSTSLSNFCQVGVVQLTKDWTLSNGLTLASGTLILGLNDKGSKDGDFDDFIIAASKPAATPVPAAVWMLGSGVLALMGYRRVRQNESN